jgi:hypothetical protein
VRLTKFALALCTLLLVGDLEGQMPLDAALRTLKPGERVRIRVRGGDRIEARIASVQTEPLRLQLMGAGAALDTAAIDSLWVRGQATRIGTNTGAIVGGVLSFGFWGALCSSLGEGNGCDAWGQVAALGVAGAIAGALIGGGLGALTPSWKLRYAPAVPVQAAPMLLPKGRLGLGVAYRVHW